MASGTSPIIADEIRRLRALASFLTPVLNDWNYHPDSYGSQSQSHHRENNDVSLAHLTCSARAGILRLGSKHTSITEGLSPPPVALGRAPRDPRPGKESCPAARGAACFASRILKPCPSPSPGHLSPRPQLAVRERGGKMPVSRYRASP
jgi:hypothetical protein